MTRRRTREKPEVRRSRIIEEAFRIVGELGYRGFTVQGLAERCGLTNAGLLHYFGGKEDLLFAAMRHILGLYGASVRAELARADTPRDRLAAIIRASFGPDNFEPEVIAAWLSFYVHAQSDPGARRLLGIYQSRLGSNLTQALRPLAGDRAADIAWTLAAVIDGLYIRHALGGAPDGPQAAARVLALADTLVATP